MELLAAATPTAPLTSATGKLGGVGEVRSAPAPAPKEEEAGRAGGDEGEPGTGEGLSPGECACIDGGGDLLLSDPAASAALMPL